MKQFATYYADENGEHRSTPVSEEKALEWARLMRANGYPEATVVCREYNGDYWRQVWPKP